jgi:hypothetical protein
MPLAVFQQRVLRCVYIQEHPDSSGTCWLAAALHRLYAVTTICLVRGVLLLVLHACFCFFDCSQTRQSACHLDLAWESCDVLLKESVLSCTLQAHFCCALLPYYGADCFTLPLQLCLR